MKTDELRREYVDALRDQDVAWRDLAVEIPKMESIKGTAALGAAWAARYEIFSAARAHYLKALDAYWTAEIDS